VPEQKSTQTNYLTLRHHIQTMKLKLHNIFVLFLTRLPRSCCCAMATPSPRLWTIWGGSAPVMGRLGSGHSNDEKTVGLLALGFIGVNLVAIVELFAQDRRQNPPERRRGPPED
jgi:hypothetical protein